MENGDASVFEWFRLSLYTKMTDDVSQSVELCDVSTRIPTVLYCVYVVGKRKVVSRTMHVHRERRAFFRQLIMLIGPSVATQCPCPIVCSSVYSMQMYE